MASMASAGWTFYKAGTVVASAVVGYEGKTNRVLRYEFKTGAEGASHIRILLGYMAHVAGTAQTINWYIGADPNSHVNAGAGSASMGIVEADPNDTAGTDHIVDADVVLLPNTTYYFWIFPSVAEYGYYEVNTHPSTNDLTMTGGAGLIYIDNGESCDAYQAYIDNGTGFDLCLPHTDNGTSFDLNT